MLQLGLVLLEINGVKFVRKTETDDNQKDTNVIIESLLNEWDGTYVKVRLKILFKFYNSEIQSKFLIDFLFRNCARKQIIPTYF